MAYEKQTWQTGDVVTSAKLNHMEDGIAAGGGSDSLLLVTLAYDEDADDGTYTSSATFAEIIAASEAGKIVVVQEAMAGSFFPIITSIMGRSAISGLSFAIGISAGGKNLAIDYWIMDEATNKWAVEAYHTSITSD